MNKFSILISILLISSILLAQSATVELISPIAGKEIHYDEVEFHFKYRMGDTGDVDAICVLNLDNSPIATITTQTNGDAFYSSTSIQSGNHTWNMVCNSVSSQNETFVKKPKAASVELNSPENNFTTFDAGAEFNFTYHAGEAGNDSANCYLFIGEAQLGPLELPSEQEGSIEIEELPRTQFEWYAICDGVESEKRVFAAQQFNPTSVESVSPEAGKSFDYNNPEFSFIYRAGTKGPKEAFCQLVILPFVEGTANATDGEVTKIKTSNLKVGSQLWYIECNRGGEYAGHYANSGDAREFIITSSSPKLNETQNQSQNTTQNQTQNETQVPGTPSVPQAVLIAPSLANANDNVSLKLLNENGTPIANATIRIIPRTGAPQMAFTDEQGIAKFISDSPMSFSYEVIGYELASSPFTNVVFSAPSVNASQDKLNGNDSKTKSDNLILYLAVFIAILAIAAYLLFRPKKPNHKLHKSHAHTQDEGKEVPEKKSEEENAHGG